MDGGKHGKPQHSLEYAPNQRYFTVVSALRKVDNVTGCETKARVGRHIQYDAIS